MLEIALGGGHDGLEPLLGLGFARWREHEPHPAARHAAQHPEAVEVLTKLGADLLNEALGVVGGGPGDDGLDRTFKITGGDGSDFGDVALAEGSDDFIEKAQSFLPGGPLGSGP